MKFLFSFLTAALFFAVPTQVWAEMNANLCIQNQSDKDIVIKTKNIDNYDWGGGRPDHRFNNIFMPGGINRTYCATLESTFNPHVDVYWNFDIIDLSNNSVLHDARMSLTTTSKSHTYIVTMSGPQTASFALRGQSKFMKIGKENWHIPYQPCPQSGFVYGNGWVPSGTIMGAGGSALECSLLIFK